MGWTSSDEDLKEVATLLNADVLFVATAERRADSLFVRTGVRFPRRAPLRTLAGTIAGTNLQALADSVVSAIKSDTTYQRMRGPRPR